MRIGRLLRGLWRRGDWLLSEKIVPSLVWPLGFLRSNAQIVQAWPALDAPLGPRVVLFCHFDAGGKIRDYTIKYLAELKRCGFSVVLVSNSGRLLPEALARLQVHCDAIIVRRNVGYDFGAWQDAMRQMCLPRPDTHMLVLANDSVYGPLQPLQDTIDRIDLRAADVWGVTDSWQTRFHLQSYFLAVGRRALENPAWADFWSGVRPVPSKIWVIRHYEVGLSQRLMAAGMKLQAVWPYMQLLDDTPAAPPHSAPDGDDEVPPNDWETEDPFTKLRRQQARRIARAAARRMPLNPTADLWRQLLLAGYPFIKRELLRDNPSEVNDIADWRAVISRDLQADLSAIDADLRRVLRNRAP